MSSIYILAIETSCDDTGVAVVKDGHLLAHTVSGQPIHSIHGGVVPELASRAHQQHLVSLVDATLSQANITKSDLNAVAFTQGPGLLGALLVGASFAKALAMALDLPLLAVHHMQAHVLANFITPPYPVFPFLSLVVSGGHTQLVLVESALRLKILGETKDDAVGEAFDKIAKLLNLSYPGGPKLAQYARHGDAQRFLLPKTYMPGLDFSFSGIKNAVRMFLIQNKVKNPNFVEEHLPHICASVQATLVNMLVDKVVQAMDQTHLKTIALAGGVAANWGLRERLTQLSQQHQWSLYMPDVSFCTDNAAMVGVAGYAQYQAQQFCTYSTDVQSRMPYASVGEGL